MDSNEIMAALSKEISVLNQNIDKQVSEGAIVKGDVAKLAERLEAFAKIAQAAVVSKEMDASNPANFWKTEKDANGFAEFLADGPLASYAHKYAGTPIFKGRVAKTIDANSVGTDADGGYLAPTEFSSYLLDRGLSYGQSLSRFPRQQVIGKSFDIATDDTDLTALWAVNGAGATSEDHTKLVQKMVFNHVALTPKTMYALRALSNKLFIQSRFAVANMVGNSLAKSINKLMAYSVWKADGTDDVINGAVTGIAHKSGIGEVNLTTASQLYTTNATGSPGNSDATVKGMDAIVKMMNLATTRAYQPDSAFYCHRITLNSLYTLKDTVGQPIIRDAFVAGFGNVPVIRGYPVVVDEIFDHQDVSSSNGDCLLVFGSATQGGVIGYNQDVRISLSEHVRFLQNQMLWKAEIEADFQVTDVGAWARIVV